MTAMITKVDDGMFYISNTSKYSHKNSTGRGVTAVDLVTIPSVFLVAAILVVLAGFPLGVVSTTLPVDIIIRVVAAILVVLVLIPILIVLVRHRFPLADIEY